MAMLFNSCPPPATSLQWVGQGHVQRILYNYVNRLRKYLFSKHDDLFYFFTPSPSLITPKRSNCAPPALTTGQISLPIHPSLPARVFGWLLCLIVRLGAI
jgi:hypothetical protein